jgi:2-polyprenyl-6-methoxyphenol hydroxylase-like FAD-dependent oxidoreductase
MRTHADVLVVGAGPVGLLLAAELSRDGVDVLLIDRLATRSFFSKALGVTSRTLEIFDDLGIAHDAIDVGVWLRGIASFTDGAPGPAMDIPADLPFDILSLAQFDTERVLRGRMFRFSRGAPGQPDSASLVAIPVHGSPRRYRLSSVLPDGASSPGAEVAPTLEQVTATMASLLPHGTVLSSLHWSSVYRGSHRIVPAYSRGRVLLASDAAHIHPPVGGQGMNTGLQDAHGLAWRLGLASRGLAAAGLFDSYNVERRAVGLDVVENTSRALNEVLAQRVQLPGVRETQLLISYRGSAIVRDERKDAAAATLAAGDRAPDAGQLRRDCVGRAIRLHERLGRGRHVLFGYLADDAATADMLADLLGLLKAAFGNLAGGFAIAPPGHVPPERDDLPILRRRRGRVRRRV